MVKRKGVRAVRSSGTDHAPFLPKAPRKQDRVRTRSQKHGDCLDERMYPNDAHKSRIQKRYTQANGVVCFGSKKLFLQYVLILTKKQNRTI